MDPSSLCRLRRQCVLRLRRDVRRLLDKDGERTSRTSSRSGPLATRWSIVCWHSRVETRAVHNGALTTARGDRSHCYERHAESGEEANGRQNRVAQGELLGSDAENPGDDGGHAETSGRLSVQSREEELIDEASFQPQLFCGTSYMDGVDLCAHRGLFDLWGLSSFDKGWIRWHRDSTKFHSAHAKDILSSKAARRESQHANFQHCLSQ